MSEAATIACPMCGEDIKAIAKKCKHCGESVEKGASRSTSCSSISSDSKAKVKGDFAELTMPTGKLVGLTAATGGLYIFLHLFKVLKPLNKKLKDAINPTVFLVAVILFGLGLQISSRAAASAVSANSIVENYRSEFLRYADRASYTEIIEQSTMIISQIGDSLDFAWLVNTLAEFLIIGSSIAFIMIAFKMKKALESYTKDELDFDLKLNPVATAFFSIFYINFSIQKLMNN